MKYLLWLLLAINAIIATTKIHFHEPCDTEKLYAITIVCALYIGEILERKSK